MGKKTRLKNGAKILKIRHQKGDYMGVMDGYRKAVFGQNRQKVRPNKGYMRLKKGQIVLKRYV